MFNINTRPSKPLPVPLLPDKVNRWGARRKVVILKHLEGRDRAFIQEVLEHYHISQEEFVEWRKVFYHKGGILSLRASKKPIITDDETSSPQE